MTWLDDSQVQWVYSQVQKAKSAKKRVIFTSHHQLFTSASTVGQNASTRAFPSVNTRLHQQLAGVINDIDIWFW